MLSLGQRRESAAMAVIAAMLLMGFVPLLACPAPRSASASMACCRKMAGSCMRQASERSCCQHDLVPPAPVLAQSAAPNSNSVPLPTLNGAAPAAVAAAAASRHRSVFADPAPPPLSPLTSQSLLRI